MNNINTKLYDELFKRKVVAIQADLYNDLYDCIWPCEQTFINFLTTSDTSLRFNYAKEIYEYIQMVDDITIPSSTIDKLLYLQTYDLVDKEAKYIPQDHVIHSVNLYILGIFLFFNHEVFFEKIVGKPSWKKELTYEIENFVSMWKIFAFYHDVGYYIESTIDKDGFSREKNRRYVKEYENIFYEMLYNYVIRHTSRLILLSSLISRSNKTLDIKELSNTNIKGWVELNGSKLKKETFTQSIENFSDLILINDIQDAKGIKNILPLLDKNKYVLLIYNDRRNLNYIILNKDKKDCYINKLCSNREYLSVEDILSNSKGIVQLYVEKKSNILRPLLQIDEEQIVKSFYDDLPQSIKTSFSTIVSNIQIEDIFHKICNWLKLRTQQSKSFDMEKLYNIPLTNYYHKAIQEAFNQFIIKYIRDELDSEDIQPKNLETIIKNISNCINRKQSRNTLVENTQNIATETQLADNGVSYNILKYCSEKYFSILNDCVEKETGILNDYLKELMFIRMNTDSEYDINLFAHSEAADATKFENKLYKKLLQFSDELNVSFEDLLNYKPNHTKCDHGLVSAGLIFQSVVFCNYLIENCKKNKDISLSWYNGKNTECFCDEENVEKYASIIFSILIHNIYTKKSGAKYGIKYTQDIDKNPFSYFCAFCDTFQKWHRPKQIDLSRSFLSDGHFLEDDFDISVDGAKIILKCNMQNASIIRNRIKDEETFLLGLSNLVEIREI